MNLVDNVIDRGIVNRLSGKAHLFEVKNLQATLIIHSDGLGCLKVVDIEFEELRPKRIAQILLDGGHNVAGNI